MLAEGKTIPRPQRRWRSRRTRFIAGARYGGMKADDVKRLKELERENVTLERIVPTRSWRTWRCGRSRRETGEPVAPAPGGPDAQGSPRRLGAAGVPDHGPGSLPTAPRAFRDEGRRGFTPLCARSRSAERKSASSPEMKNARRTCQASKLVRSRDIESLTAYASGTSAPPDEKRARRIERQHPRVGERPQPAAVPTAHCRVAQWRPPLSACPLLCTGGFAWAPDRERVSPNRQTYATVHAQRD
jgi:hypothetical protein